MKESFVARRGGGIWVLWISCGLWLGMLTSAPAQSQDTGTVSGVAQDSMQGAPVGGVVVSVRGTTIGTRTDAQGRYTLDGVPPGDHILIFSKPGFERATAANVRVLIGQTSRADGRINPEYYEMDTYEVVAEFIDDEFGDILLDRQASLQLVDAIGSDYISQVGASDAAGAVARVTGVTIADGKFAVIRGLADRYTFTTLNGLELPSADRERKAVQLDLYPAQAIDRVEVTKTFTPDQPGNTTGGRVNIVTKSFPEEFIWSFKAGVSYNTQASLRDDFYGSPTSGGTDFWAMDDGTRQMPDQLAALNYRDLLVGNVDQATQTGIHQALNKGFAGENRRTPLDTKFSLFLGDTTEILGMPLGVIASFSHDRRFHYYEDGIQVRYDTGSLVADFSDKRGSEEVLWGALGGLALELQENHKLDFTFSYNQASENEARFLEGEREEVPGTMQSYVVEWTERNVTSFQLRGDHHLPEVLDMQINWGASFSTTTEDTPDQRLFATAEEERLTFLGVNPNPPPAYLFATNLHYAIGLNTLEPVQKPTVYWRELTGDNKNFTFDDSIPFEQWSGLESQLKFGAYYSGSSQSFAERAYTFDTYEIEDVKNPWAYFSTNGDPNLFLREEAITPDSRGRYDVRLTDFTARTSYEGTLDVPALYLMTDLAISEPLKFVGGVRYERTDQEVTTRTWDDLAGRFVTSTGKIEEDDWLPAAGFIYSVAPTMKLRLNYGRTVARPTFREMSGAVFFDFAGGDVFEGNPDLARSTADNFDLRWEWFPEAGDVLAASVFYKKIQDPIEVAQQNQQGNIKYINSEQADVYGLELETRKGLGFVHSSLAGFSLGANYAYLISEVPRNPEEYSLKKGRGWDIDENRPLYDQPTYVFNADLSYTHPSWGTSATISYNVTGERLVISSFLTPDVYQQPVPVLNFTLSQPLWKSWKLGFSAKNILNSEIRREYKDVGPLSPASGQTYSEFTGGITFGISLSGEF